MVQLKNGSQVEKRNALNEIRVSGMTMQQVRFFAIYLSKINARDESTRQVRFPLGDFQRIMGLGRLNIKYLEDATDNLLRQIVRVPRESGGFEKFQLFKKCRVDCDELGEWYVEIDAHDDALQLFFDFKEKYFVYDVGNILHLSSKNQMRMYEILKQRQGMKQPVKIQLQELKELLFIKQEEYKEFKYFKRDVLEISRSVIGEKTDIRFDYKPLRKGRKVVAIEFDIQVNEASKLIPSLNIEEFVKTLVEPEQTEAHSHMDDASDENQYIPMSKDDTEFYVSALPPGLTAQQIHCLQGLSIAHIGNWDSMEEAKLQVYHYMLHKTQLLYAQNKPVANVFGWLKKAIKEDWQ